MTESILSWTFVFLMGSASLFVTLMGVIILINMYREVIKKNN